MRESTGAVMTSAPWHIGFEAGALTAEQLEAFARLRRQCASDIVTMTTLAGCGHPGGSLSSLDALLVVYATCALRPEEPLWPERDRVIVSHGHISPGVYSVLGAFGFIDREDAVRRFRHIGSPYGGHVESRTRGVEWNSGNLGQGLSAGCAAALAARLQGRPSRAIVLMGDGEQQKGQVMEARRFARKLGLGNLIAIVDWNNQQIGGPCDQIMPTDLVAEYQAAGWRTVEVDGHDVQALYRTLRRAHQEWGGGGQPTALLARTTMGKGVSFMEAAGCGFHGKAASEEEYRLAMRELEAPDRLAAYRNEREALPAEMAAHSAPAVELPVLEVGPAITYPVEKKLDCRSAYGNVLRELAERNNLGSHPRVVGISCDLEGSVKMDAFHKVSPEAFLECGISEHHAAVLAGRLAREGLHAFLSTFGIFAVSEVYNQQRLNDYNHAPVRVVATHCGLNVGEDGPTHQVIDYISLLSNLFSFEILLPADPNQCDRIIRYAAGSPGPVFVGMGRSKVPALLDEDGTPFYGEQRPVFTPGQADVVREGDDGALLACGSLVGEAVRAHERLLRERDLRVRVVNMASIKPLDRKAILDAAGTGMIITVEDHHVDTGLGSLVANVLAEEGSSVWFHRRGVDRYGASAPPEDLYRAFGLDGNSLAELCLEVL